MHSRYIIQSKRTAPKKVAIEYPKRACVIRALVFISVTNTIIGNIPRYTCPINPDDLKGSAMEAAVTSFFLFGIGAILPVIPFFFFSGSKAIVLSTILSAFGLFLIGAAITLFTGKSVWFSGFRQVLFGLVAAAITFGIGKLIGVSIAG